MRSLTKTSPDVRVRKLMGYWCVQARTLVKGHPVWQYVGAFDSWAVAFAVAEVEASPDTWPFYMEGCHE